MSTVTVHAETWELSGNVYPLVAYWNTERVGTYGPSGLLVRGIDVWSPTDGMSTASVEYVEGLPKWTGDLPANVQEKMGEM